MAEMTLPQFNRWIKELADDSKWGWLPEWRKSAAYIRRQTGKNFRGHRSPDGVPWAPRWQRPLPKVGDVGPIEKRGGKDVRIKITTVKQKRKVKRFLRKSKRNVARKIKAIYRTGGGDVGPARRTTKFYGFLTAPITGAKRGKQVAMWKTGMWYGIPDRFSTLHTLQGGGTYRGKKVPSRPMLGLTNTDIAFIVSVMDKGVEKRLLRGK